MAAQEELSSVGDRSHSLETALQIQLEDFEHLADKAKGKQREGFVSDRDTALQMYVEDVADQQFMLSDQRLAQSIALAVAKDGDFIQQTFDQEQQIAAVRRLAIQLSGAGSTVSDDQITVKHNVQQDDDPWQDAEFLAKVAAMYLVSADSMTKYHQSEEQGNNEHAYSAESSKEAALRGVYHQQPFRLCASCGEEKDFIEVVRVPCKHEYCQPCLEQLFSLSMKDESLFPPRCDHEEIPLKRVRFFLPSDLAAEFEARYTELSTKNKTFCHNTACQKFIDPVFIAENLATCPKCSSATCTICKASSHAGDCPADESLQQLIQLAETEQWQRCHQCHRLVDLVSGCHHMTCPCGAAFCYVCGRPWKNCPCPQWEEVRLEERATQLVDRHPRRRLFQPPRQNHQQPGQNTSASSSGNVAGPSRQAQHGAHSQEESSDDGDDNDEADASRLETLRTVRIAAVAGLRANHACEHDNWRYRAGPHTCEECRYNLPKFILECRQCHLQACKRCTMNRL